MEEKPFEPPNPPFNKTFRKMAARLANSAKAYGYGTLILRSERGSRETRIIVLPFPTGEAPTPDSPDAYPEEIERE